MTRYFSHSVLCWSLGVCLGLALCGSAVRAEETPATEEEPLPLMQADEAADGQPELMDAFAVATDDDQGIGGKEVIRERFANGAVRIEREVIQDAEENYVNQGNWQMWDERGNRVATGQYRGGKRHGTWTSWHLKDESSLFSSAPFNAFTSPFISQAVFEDGNLHGTWMIYDAKQRKICEWPYEDGERHGKWTWWYPSGRKMQEVTYEHGDVEGEVFQWNAASRLVAKSMYEEGRRLEKKTVYHPDSQRQKKTEGMYLFAKRVPQSPDNWWNARLAPEKPVGKDEKHGFWTSWHPNGQEKMRGKYRYDVEVGKFTWWHSNGQKSVEGTFENGKRHSKWTWWHPNGQKSAQGQFSYGGQNGRWIYWNPTGKVTQRVDFSGGSETNVAERRTSHGEPSHDEQPPLTLKR